MTAYVYDPLHKPNPPQDTATSASISMRNLESRRTLQTRKERDLEDQLRTAV